MVSLIVSTHLIVRDLLKLTVIVDDSRRLKNKETDTHVHVRPYVYVTFVYSKHYLYKEEIITRIQLPLQEILTVSEVDWTVRLPRVQWASDRTQFGHRLVGQTITEAMQLTSHQLYLCNLMKKIQIAHRSVSESVCSDYISMCNID